MIWALLLAAALAGEPLEPTPPAPVFLQAPPRGEPPASCPQPLSEPLLGETEVRFVWDPALRWDDGVVGAWITREPLSFMGAKAHVVGRCRPEGGHVLGLADEGQAIPMWEQDARGRQVCTPRRVGPEIVTRPEGGELAPGLARADLSLDTGGDQMMMGCTEVGLVLRVSTAHQTWWRTVASCHDAGFGDFGGTLTLGTPVLEGDCGDHAIALVLREDRAEVLQDGTPIGAIPLPEGHRWSRLEPKVPTERASEATSQPD